MTLSSKIRQSALDLVHALGRAFIPAIAAFFHPPIHPASVYRWISKVRNGGRLQPDRKRINKGWSTIIPLHFQLAEDLIEINPMYYPAELSEKVNQHFNTTYDREDMRHAMEEAGYTGKVLEYRAKEQCAPLRALFRHFMSQFAARQIVFADESHLKPSEVRRRYGYSLRGAVAFMYTYFLGHGYGAPCSSICAMSLSGMFYVNVKEEMITAAIFEQSLHEILNEILLALISSTIIVV